MKTFISLILIALLSFFSYWALNHHSQPHLKKSQETQILVQELKKRMSAHPEKKLAYLEKLALLYYQNKRYTEAMESFKELVSSQPNDSENQYRLACSYQALGMERAAAKEFQEVHRRDPKHLKAADQLLSYFENDQRRLELAKNAYLAHQYQLANKHYQILKKRHPENLSILLSHTVVLTKLKLHDEAISLHLQIREKDPKNINNLLLLAKTYLLVQNQGQAKMMNQEVLAIHPNHPLALRNLQSLVNSEAPTQPQP